MNRGSIMIQANGLCYTITYTVINTINIHNQMDIAHDSVVTNVPLKLQSV